MLSLPFFDCADFSIDDWHAKVTAEMVDWTKNLHVSAKKRFRKWGELFKLVMAARIFPLADYDTQGWDYVKPINYLSEFSSPASFGTQVYDLEQGKPLLLLQLLQVRSAY